MKKDVVSNKKVWLITGAGRGMAADIARAVLAAGHAVVATGRDVERMSSALGKSNDLLAVKLDVTNPADAESPRLLDRRFRKSGAHIGTE